MGKSILVVEDEATKRLTLRFTLQPFGAVVEARSEKDAMRRIAELHSKKAELTLSIVDLRLPANGVMDSDAGFRIIDRLAKCYPSTSVIILTIRNDKPAWQKASAVETVRYLFAKPWESVRLSEAVEACLNGQAKGFKMVGQFEDYENNI